MTNIIHYSQKYENEVVELWNRTCRFDALCVEKFRNQAVLDDNFDPELSWIALDQDCVVGFIYGTKRKFPYLERGLEPDRGWINVMFVDQAYWNQGIGQQLLDLCETELKRRGCRNITLGAYSPSYFFWGVDPVHYPEAIRFFERNGYVREGMHYSMGMDLHGYSLPPEILKKKASAEARGYRFLPFEYLYCLELLQFLKEEFGGGWKRDALMAMQKGEAQNRILLVLDPQGKICGFCTRAIDENPMRFGPIGVSKKERNAGLGSILLSLGCYEMSKRGIYRMYFITTDEPGKRYYERNGLTVIRTTASYKKEI